MTAFSDAAGRPHPRRIGWIGTTALAMGGSNQMVFLITALVAGEGDFSGHGSAAVLLLVVGLLLSWAAAPGWTELVLMFPNRVGGISATCAEAFRPYSAVLSNLTGVCYWWGWVPTCGLTALLSAAAINQWFLPSVPVPLLACAIVLLFTAVNLCGVHWATRLAVPIATASALLAALSALIPILSGTVDWQQATTFHLVTPFPGLFGEVTSAMAGLYLIGFAAPAFEQASSHVGETIDPRRNVPRAMLASALMAALYFIVLPVVWLGALGPQGLATPLMDALGPTYAPLFGTGAKIAALWFMMFNMFHGTLAPLAGAARVLSQLAEDGLLPRLLSWRLSTDAPWVATLLTAAMAIIFLLAGDPVWLIAAANLTYLIGICLPNVAVWLLRRNEPDAPRLYRAPRGTIGLGLVAAAIWGVSAVLGFQQYGLPTVLFGIAFAYAGSALYAVRVWSDRRRQGLRGLAHTLHIKLTGAMILVLVLDGIGYLIMYTSVESHHTALISILADIFVVVALLTISVGLILPGMIAHSAEQVSTAATRLTGGTLADFARAMQALSAGDLDGAHARVDIEPVRVHTRDELGTMAARFNELQDVVKRTAVALDGAREGLRGARDELREANTQLERRVEERTAQVRARTTELESEISERKRAETQLSEQELRIRTILQSIADGILTVDDDGAIRWLNRAAEEMFGRGGADVIGQRVTSLVPGLDAPGAGAPGLRRGRRNDAGEQELEGRRRDGSAFPIALRISESRLGGERIWIWRVQDITERKQAEEKFAVLNKQLLSAARAAGMAEVATSVLHNVGNVLNSINVSSGLVVERLQRVKFAGLAKAVELIQAHPNDLASFLTADPQGKQVAPYLASLAAHWQAEREAILSEVGSLTANVRHIKDIVTMQQSLSGVSGLAESVSLPDVFEDAMAIGADFERSGVRVVREFAPLPLVLADRVKLLQILVNLVRNAKDALLEGGAVEKQVTLRAASNGDGLIRLQVIDNGVGIRPEHMTQIFSYGFTTKPHGHGFGLHSSALAAKELGGSLRADSDGYNRGAAFTLQIPLRTAAGLEGRP